MTLTEFLLARIVEDEAAARHVPSPSLPEATIFVAVGGMKVRLPNPARLRAECEAKRAIVERWQSCWAVNGGPTLDVLGWEQEQEGIRLGLEAALRLLALVYADHPDYDEAWRP